MENQNTALSTIKDDAVKDSLTDLKFGTRDHWQSLSVRIHRKTRLVYINNDTIRQNEPLSISS